MNTDNHDHNMNTHEVDCSVEGCTYVAGVHAHDDEGAIAGLTSDLVEHSAGAHSDTSMSSEDVRAHVKENMTTKQ